MKNLLLLISLLIFALLTQAQEVITGGSMDNEESWITYWRTDSPDQGYHTFDYQDDTPTDGNGGCLEVYGFGQSGIFVFQEVTIEPGANYTFDAVIKNISPEPLANTWVELILSSTRPDDETMGDWGSSNGDYAYAQNSWMEEPYNTMDTDDFFSDTYQFTWNGGIADGENIDLTGSPNLSIPDTISNTTWYVCFKAGCWNDAADETLPYNFLIDNISLIKVETGTGINILNEETTFSKVFPNPSAGKINLKTAKKASYSINNLSGKALLSGTINNELSLDVSYLNKGLYTITIVSEQKTETHKLILK